MNARITTDASDFSYLTQRLIFASNERISAINLVENVPKWPRGLEPRLQVESDALNYSPTGGEELLLKVISDRENKRLLKSGKATMAADQHLLFGPQNILVTNGATQALSLILGDFPGKRGTIICQSPTFIGIASLMERYGYEICYLAGRNSFIEQLSENITDDVAAIYVNTPNNPTGYILDQQEMNALVELAQRHDIKLIIDAVYEDFVFDDVPFSLPACKEIDQVYLMNSMSKNYGLPGLRIGWVVSTESNILRLAGQLERECVAVSGVTQLKAAEIISQSNRPLVEFVDKARQPIYDLLSGIRNIEYEPTSAGTQIMVTLDVDDVEAFADHALVEHHLILATAKNYAGLNTQSIRIPLGLERADAAKGLGVLEEALESYCQLAK